MNFAGLITSNYYMGKGILVPNLLSHKQLCILGDNIEFSLIPRMGLWFALVVSSLNTNFLTGQREDDLLVNFS